MKQYGKGQRRHRINDSELFPVMMAVHNELSSAAQNKKLTLATDELFRVLFRFHKHTAGKPGYPEDIDADEVQNLLTDTLYLFDAPRD